MSVSARLAPPYVSDNIAQQAAEWLVRLGSDTSIHADFEAWKQADPRHAAAAAKLEGFIGQVQTLRSANGAQPALNTLRALERKRARTGHSVAALLLIVVLALKEYRKRSEYDAPCVAIGPDVLSESVREHRRR